MCPFVGEPVLAVELGQMSPEVPSNSNKPMNLWFRICSKSNETVNSIFLWKLQIFSEKKPLSNRKFLPGSNCIFIRGKNTLKNFIYCPDNRFPIISGYLHQRFTFQMHLVHEPNFWQIGISRFKSTEIERVTKKKEGICIPTFSNALSWYHIDGCWIKLPVLWRGFHQSTRRSEHPFSPLSQNPQNPHACSLGDVELPTIAEVGLCLQPPET